MTIRKKIIIEDDLIDCLKNGFIIDCETLFEEDNEIDYKQYFPNDLNQALELETIHESLMTFTIQHTQYLKMVIDLAELINLRTDISNAEICSFIKTFEEMGVLEDLMKLNVKSKQLNITQLINHMQSQLVIISKHLEILVKIYNYLIQRLGQINYTLDKKNYKNTKIKNLVWL